MAVKLFAAIVIGSTETEMKIFELSERKGMKEIDCLSTRLNLGIDAYETGTLPVAKVEELCRILKDFRKVMEGYQIAEYRLCATSALRELRSSLITKDYIEKQTGLKINILSNSEQRFLDYKSIASESSSFETIIQKGTAIVDIGGNSIQISVFDNDKLITTQNIRMGRVSTRERLWATAKNTSHFERMVVELMEHELNGFGKLYQKDRQIENLIVVDNDLNELIAGELQKQSDTGADKEKTTGHAAVNAFPVISKAEFQNIYDQMIGMTPEELTNQFAISADCAPFIAPSAIFAKCLLEKLGAEKLWLAEVRLGDGICYDYAVSKKYLKPRHSFDEDILAASRSIAKRYKSNQAHIKNMEELSLAIFDKMKKIHGMGQRERLLLRISAILHNCGKYISLTNVSECAYNIIMATEIIGLSHAERQIIANVVKFNTMEFSYYNDLAVRNNVSMDEYLIISKLTAILRLANALDRSHKQKFKGAAISLRDERLIISVTSRDDLTLEKTTLTEKTPFFEEVFNIHPEIKQKKQL